MGGGNGGYDRPSDSGGSGSSSGDSNEDEPNRVPPPESEPEEETTEDQSDGSNGTSDEATPEGSPAAGGGGSGGAPVAGPGEGSGSTPEKEDSEPEGSGDDSGHNDQESDDQDATDSGPEAEPDDTDSKKDEQEGGQQDREEDQKEDREHERDDEDAEDDEDEDKEDTEEDECLISESAILHSPNPEPLEDAVEGDIYSVHLREDAVCVVDFQGRTIGAIAEPWVGTLRKCLKQGRQYRARVLDIDGGRCEVRVTNKCLLNQEINLTSINTTVQDQLHPGLSLPVETTTKEVVVVTADGSRVGGVPEPWAQLLNECIDQGWSYQAEVRDVTPEYCRVNIQNNIGDE